MVDWDAYRYTDPLSEALAAALGTTVELYNTGGGCICLHATLEGGIYILVGSGTDGPLLRACERVMSPHGGGYGVGVYDTDSGDTRAYACDEQATTGEQVVELAQRALTMASKKAGGYYPAWRKDAAGKIAEKLWRD